MAEYIEREKLYKFLSEQQEKITGAYSRGRNDGLNIAKSALHNREITPAADVAPVVRCSQCQDYEDGKCYSSELWKMFNGDIEALYFEPDPDFFCGHGIRREDDHG